MKVTKIAKDMEISIEFETATMEVKEVMDFLGFRPCPEPVEQKEEEASRNPLNEIVNLLSVNGYMDKKEIKKKLRGLVSQSRIESLIKENNGTIFKYRKNGDTWEVGLIEDKVNVTEFKIEVVEDLF